MQFVIIGDDRNNALDLRQKTRSDHLDYWARKGAQFLAAGPFLDEEERPVGSMIVIEADSLEQAKSLAAADPYVSAGVFERHDVRRWNWLFGKPENQSGGN